jgi:K(+)-stimulated pyrophosphate-energized sodium pump
MNNMLFYAVPAMGLIGLLYTLVKFLWVSKQDAGNPRMKEISDYIAEGAMAFLKAEWKILAYFVVIVALLLGFMANSNESSHWSIAISFVIGAVFSATAGYIGMKVATKANSTTATEHYLWAITNTRRTVSDEVIAEFEQDIESIGRL